MPVNTGKANKLVVVTATYDPNSRALQVTPNPVEVPNGMNAIQWRIDPNAQVKFLGVVIEADAGDISGHREWQAPTFHTVTDSGTTYRAMTIVDSRADSQTSTHAYAILYTQGSDGQVRVLDPGIQNEK